MQDYSRLWAEGGPLDTADETAVSGDSSGLDWTGLLHVDQKDEVHTVTRTMQRWCVQWSFDKDVMPLYLRCKVGIPKGWSKMRVQNEGDDDLPSADEEICQIDCVLLIRWL